MIVGHRSRISLSQLLLVLPGSDCRALVIKHQIVDGPDDYRLHHLNEELLRPLLSADATKVAALLDEMVRTKRTLRSGVTKYVFDERWDDLRRCLLLDGVREDDRVWIETEPHLGEDRLPEDDLTASLQSVDFDTADVLSLLSKSADDFRKNPPDYNGCLSNARIALEQFVRGAAQAASGVPLQKWGDCLLALRSNSLISQSDEQTIAAIYTFVSPGAHRPISIDEEEFARIGRNLVLGFLYFLCQTYRSRTGR